MAVPTPEPCWRPTNSTGRAADSPTGLPGCGQSRPGPGCPGVGCGPSDCSHVRSGFTHGDATEACSALLRPDLPPHYVCQARRVLGKVSLVWGRHAAFFPKTHTQTICLNHRCVLQLCQGWTAVLPGPAHLSIWDTGTHPQTSGSSLIGHSVIEPICRALEVTSKQFCCILDCISSWNGALDSF